MATVFDPLHQEAYVPVAERFLMLEGKLNPAVVEERIKRQMPAAIAKYADRLTPDWHQAIAAYQQLRESETSIYFAVSFAYAQLPVGKTFAVLFPARRPDLAVHAPVNLVAVIFEWLPLPMPCIEAGHRSICMLDFPAGVPDLIQNFREVETFMQYPPDANIWLCSTETWQHLIANQSSVSTG